ncbi:glycosyltransferase family 9 protein [Sinorhizobium meliloti]
MDLRSARTPVLLFMNARGDHLLNLPAIRALALAFEGRLTLVCRTGARWTFFGDVEFARVVEVPAECIGLQYCFNDVPVAEALGDTDLFMCLNPIYGESVKSLVRSLRPPVTIGFDAECVLPLELDFTLHNADLAFRLPQLVSPGIVIEPFAAKPAVGQSANALAAKIRATLPGDATLITVHGDTKPEKCWAHERWTAFAALVQREEGTFIADLGVRPIDFGDGILDEDRIIRFGELPMRESMAIVAASDCFVGVDSCFLHAADLSRIPGVGIFGPTDVHEFGFRFAPHRHCARRDLAGLEATLVYEALLQLRDHHV